MLFNRTVYFVFRYVNGLYTDYYKFKGLNIKQKAEQLKALLKDYDYEKVIEFFRPGEKNT
ncbi:unnamed protein product [Diabrotica balteata]|uniref:BBS7 helical hairpin domain-containing protein n=1 Tax=Diabrotica balteata TaxID=107213 RepID=A0A9P0DXA5_DIABA|nr:unnamed protein product [Diabrotica balteata]